MIELEAGRAGRAMSAPLTRVDALVAAAVLANHPRRQPTWAGIADRLTAWAHEQPQTEHEEGEMPSQTGIPGAETGTLEATTETASGSAETLTEGLTTTDFLGV